MGSYISFRAGTSEILSDKSYLSSDIATLFQETDRTEEVVLNEDNKDIVLG